MNWNFFLQLIFYYLLLNIFIYFIADLAIFPIPNTSYVDKDLSPIKLKTQDGKTITAVYLENKSAHYTLLVSHGNAEDLGSLSPFLEMLREQGFSVFAYDYHGYGTSQGRPTEKNTYRDIQAAYDYLTHTLKIPAEKIILYGRSVGTGPTIDLASKIKPAGVILQSPMLTAFRVVTVFPIFILDKYQNNQKIQKITAPILFIYASDDSVIPSWHTQKLYKLATTPNKYFYAVDKANHNDLFFIAGPQYWENIQKFVKSLHK